jgi:heptaprenyl diphosphate synthase
MPADVQAMLLRVERELRDRTRTGRDDVDDITTHLLQAGGKRVRPTLLLLASDLGDIGRPGVVDAAVAVELLHLATLYHDDVEDGADRRRGVASANRVFGNRLAVFGGSFLFGRAMELFATLGDDVSRSASEAALALWRGQTLEAEHAFDLRLTRDTYFEIVEAKTASLCSLPCRLGAMMGGVPPAWRDGIGEFGRRLGIAYQIADDILDLVANPVALGKPSCSDVVAGRVTLPVLSCLRGNGGPAANRLSDLLQRAPLSPDEVAEVTRIVRESGGLNRALGAVGELVQEAEDAILGIRESAARTALIAVARRVYRRAEAHVLP